MKTMDIQSVLVEAFDTNGNEIFKLSGILINGHVFTTFPFESLDSDFKKIKENPAGNGIMNNNFEINKFTFVITTGKLSLRAKFSRYFTSEKIKRSVKKIFRFWSMNAVDNYNFDTLSSFIILKLDGCEENLEDEIREWLQKNFKRSMIRGQNLRCTCAAFGDRNFLDHYSEGIVSNILGVGGCLIFSDLPLTPGSEGSPVLCDWSDFPIGIVISTTNWWKGEWLNFTVIADFRQLLMEIAPNLRYKIENQENSQILSQLMLENNLQIFLKYDIESSLFQIYNKTIWGTAILIDKKNGIFMTNAHVVEDNKTISLHRNNEIIHCDIIYSSPTCIDVAILKSKSGLGDGFQDINLSQKKLNIGDLVYAAGFPIFPKESNIKPTITRGRIIHVYPDMIKTSCSVYRGASGGAILDEDGGLIALIVCNAETKGRINMVYPRFNMNIPISLIMPFISKYIISGDSGYLDEISLINAKSWSIFSKL